MKQKHSSNYFVRSLLATGAVLCTTAVWADDVVPVASLEVKDRIRTIDQINVSAETRQVAETPSTAAVAALLDEAEQLDTHATPAPVAADPE